MDTLLHNFNLIIEVFFLDLLLSGDNAIVIAIACRSLPKKQMRQAIFVGVIGAIILRIIFTMLSSLLLYLPLLKLVGGIVLFIIAVKLLIEEESENTTQTATASSPSTFSSAVQTVIVADLIMSVDNVVALSAATEGNIIFLAIGLLLSVPFLMYGSMIISKVLKDYPMLIQIGGALLGWIAGHIAITDTLFEKWINTQSPALLTVVPLLSSILVVMQGKIIREQKNINNNFTA